MENKELITHDEMVAKLLKPGADTLATLTPLKIDLLHCAPKICSEAGELMDAIGKYIYYEQPLDRENVIEELGDLEFYMSGLRQVLGIARSTTIQANMAKLAKRYPNYEYNNARAKERADKKYTKVEDINASCIPDASDY